MRNYGKVHTSFWTSPNVRAMSEAGRILALYLLTSPHGTIAGVFRLPDGYACEDLQWDPDQVQSGFEELFNCGFARRCETTKWVWIIKHFEWNPLENPNQKKAAAKVGAQVPDQCVWKREFMQTYGHVLGISLAPDPCQTLSKPFLIQEQEQEQKQEQNFTNPDGLVGTSVAGDPSLQSVKSPRQDCPHQKIIALYHEILPQCPQVREWTPARAAQLRARWNEDEKRQSLDYWRNFFEYVKTCEFLVGSGKNRTFIADLEWMTKSANFTKIREGKYADREAA